MGLFGGDSSSTSVTKNYVDNSSITASQNGALLGIAGNDNTVGTVNVLDGSAIKNALDFAGSASKRAFDFAGNAGARAFDFAANNNAKLMTAVSDSMTFAERASRDAMANVFAASQPATATINKIMMGIAGLAVLTITAFVFLSKGKK